MARGFAVLGLAFMTLIALPLSYCHAEDDDPVVYKKPLSEWLTILKSDKTEKNRRAALIALGDVGLRSRKTVSAVSGALHDDESAGVREAAAQLLGKLAFKAVDLLPEAQGAVRVNLQDDLKLSLSALMEALRGDKMAKVRTSAATGLGRLGPDAAPALAALIGALKDKDDAPRAAAAEALGRIGPKASDAVPSLLECLKDKKADRFVRIYAAFALGRTDGDIPVIVPALSETLGETDAHTEVRKAAAESLAYLAQIKKNTAESYPVMVKVLTKEPGKKSLEVRRAAASALNQMKPEAKAVLPDLKSALTDEDKFIRSQVLHIIGQLGPDGSEAVPDVIGRLKEDQVLEVRLAAIEALGALGVNSKEVVEALNAASRSSIAGVREAAKEALKKVQAEK
jgi:HEAT repeat protein